MDGNFPIRDLLPLRPFDGVHFAPAPQPALASLADRLMSWIERTRSRRALSQFDDRMLRDIGIDRGTAYNEVQKPFWQG
jgi:uncharacterized protein YjiS (DUF1127 family)